MKKMLLVFGLVLSLGLFFGCGKDTEKNSQSTDKTAAKTTVEKIKKTNTPTVFIHGYRGTEHSFGGMLSRFEAAGKAEKELILTVDVNGNVVATGKLSGKKDNPAVQVLFEDNGNNEWNQADWVNQVLLYLKSNYDVEHVNLVGHSMGGVASFRYLFTYAQDDTVPIVDKYLAIGAPFNDFVDTSNEQTIDEALKDGPSIASSRYEDFKANVTKIPQTIDCLLLAGRLAENQQNDGTVPVTSAFAANNLLVANGNKVQHQLFTGSQAQHSQLHENPAVDQAVAKFIWNE